MLFNCKTIIVIICILIIFTNCDDSDYFIDLLCLNPRSFILYNGNILLCCSDGLYTYDSNLKNKLFSQAFDNEISTNDAEYLTINQYPNNGNVIVITINEFYFLSPEGQVIYKDNFVLDNYGSFYTLVPFIYDNNLNFIIGFINSSRKLNFVYYKISISPNQIELIKNYSPEIKTGNPEIYGSNYIHGFTCQIMTKNNSDILVCFCCDSYPNEITSFSINIFSEDLELIDDSLRYLALEQQGKFIKSVSSPDKSKVLIGFSLITGKGYFAIYDVKNSSFSAPVQYMTIGDNPSSLLVQYFNRTQEYIFSSNKDKNFKIAKFDKDLNLIQNENLNNQIESDYTMGETYFHIYNYCITLIPEYENYIFIIDGDLNGVESGRGYLFPDILKPEEILPIPFISSFPTNMSPSIISKAASTTATEFVNKSITYLSTSSIKISHSSSSLSQTIESKYIKEDIQCSFEYFYKNIKTNECQSICSYNDFIKEICYINDLNENNIMNITEHCRNLIGKLDLNKNINVVINGNNALYQLVSSEVIDENLDENISIIDLGECEQKLKSMFTIDYILIFQVDIFLSTSTNIVMKYELYNPYTLEKVNLSICENMKINTYSPYSITDEELELYKSLKETGYDLFNPNDSFYIDSCTPYKTQNNTDILLSDRRKDYYKNKSFCEEGCTYKDYDHIHKKVQCECIVNISNNIDNNIEGVNFLSNAILDSFNDFENYTNIKILKCIKIVFSKLGQTKNFGSYIIIIFILIYIILMILFCKDGKKQLLTIINIIIIQKKKTNAPVRKKNTTKNEKKNYNNKLTIYKNSTNNNQINESKKKNKNKNKFEKKNTNKTKAPSKLISSFLPEQSPKSIVNLNKKSTLFLPFSKRSKSNENTLTHKYNDIELNGLIYQKAIIYDKRSYCQYYCALVKQKHLILFTFVSKIDYNLFIIKLSLFVFSLSLYFALNALFFDDRIIHKIYLTQGNYNLIHSLLNIIYSSIISSIIRLVLKFLALSHNSILEFKNYKNRKKMIKESTRLVKKLNIKLFFYYVISFLFLLFFWYFISAFCAIFKNSQLFFLENSVTSFMLASIYPFGLYLLPGIFRIKSLKSKDKKCMYTFSNVISFI